jgi:hypothetical protein
MDQLATGSTRNCNFTDFGIVADNGSIGAGEANIEFKPVATMA